MSGGRKAILVLGMHRSGTSALTRLVNLCGAVLPEVLLEASAEVNATGFWESAGQVALHDEVCTAMGSSWHDVRAVAPGWFESDAAAGFRVRLKALLEREYGDAPLILVKDPRLCRLLPLWLAVLAEMGIAPLGVLPVRNPLEVADSLRKRDGMGAGKALLLWLRHVLAAERNSRGFARAFVSYEQVLADAPGVVARLGRELGLEWPRAPEAAAAEMAGFVSPALRHHARAAEDDAALPWQVREAYRWHLAAAVAEPPGEVLDAIAADMDRAEPLFGAALAALEDSALSRAAELRHWVDTAVERLEAIERLRAYVEHQQREIDGLGARLGAIEGSTMWRTLAPVRAVLRRLKKSG